MLSVSEIKSFIDNDKASKKKQLAREGDRYFNGDHDIKKYRIFFINAEGVLQEDLTKSNIRICHPFYTELVDQEVQYLLSGEEGFVRSDNPELQNKLDEYFNDNEDFMAELYEIVSGAVAKGFENAYAFKNKDGITCFMCADSLGVVEVRARDTDDGCDYVIYHYVDRIDKDTKKITRIQVWDSKQVTYYVQDGEGKIELDDSQKINPRPHSTYTKEGDDSIYYEDYGFIPFFRLDNNKKQQSGLKPVKDLIDDYDLMACGLSNNIQDTNESLYVVKGFEGDNLDELMVNIKAKKHIGVGEDGDVEIKTVDIPVEARQTKLELDEKNIYRFGQGLNTAGLKDTAATTNIAIKSAYSLLDLKCNKMEIRLKQFMRKLLKVVLDEINELEGTDYQQKDVYFKFEREVPTNALENAQIELTEAQRKQTEITTILNLANNIDDETRLQLICEQLDIDYEDIKDKVPKEDDSADPFKVQSALDAVVVDDPDGGGVIE
jgi:SPP1 family phage portal protein